MAAGELAAIHSDLFDRILVAQARIEELTFLTADEKILEYGRPTTTFLAGGWCESLVNAFPPVRQAGTAT